MTPPRWGSLVRSAAPLLAASGALSLTVACSGRVLGYWQSLGAAKAAAEAAAALSE
jgi:hypothetical protein